MGSLLKGEMTEWVLLFDARTRRLILLRVFQREGRETRSKASWLYDESQNFEIVSRTLSTYQNSAHGIYDEYC